MNKKNQLRSGVILSYINLAISSVIPFAYTPVMLRMLGQAEYGLYSLASSAAAYLSLLSFGFGSTIVRYISKYRAENDRESEEKTYGFFLLLYCALAVLVLICGIIIIMNVEPIFHRGLTKAEVDKMKMLVGIMTFNTMLSFPLSVFSSMIIAHEKYIFQKLTNMIATVLAPIANLIALYLGYKAVGMAIAGTIMQFTMIPANIIYCYKNLNIRPKFSRIPISLKKEMFGFSIFVFIGSIVDMLFWATDKVILGMLESSIAVAIYNVGATFNSMIVNLSTSISGVLTPKITGMVVKEKKKEQFTELFIRIGRLQFIIIALIVSGFTVFGQTFIRLWAGNSYKDAYWVALMTMLPLCIPLIQNTGLTIVVAQNKHQFRSVVYLIIAIINVISTYLTVPYMGIIAAALCSCISYIVGQGIIMNLYYYKVTKIDIPLFWKNILKMAVVPATMTITGVFLVNNIYIENWRRFLFGVVIFSCVYAIFMYLFVLNDYEKNIFKNPVIKVLKKIDSKRNY